MRVVRRMYDSVCSASFVSRFSAVIGTPISQGQPVLAQLTRKWMRGSPKPAVLQAVEGHGLAGDDVFSGVEEAVFFEHAAHRPEVDDGLHRVGVVRVDQERELLVALHGRTVRVGDPGDELVQTLHGRRVGHQALVAEPPVFGDVGEHPLPLGVRVVWLDVWLNGGLGAVVDPVRRLVGLSRHLGRRLRGLALGELSLLLAGRLGRIGVRGRRRARGAAEQRRERKREQARREWRAESARHGIRGREATVACSAR